MKSFCYNFLQPVSIIFLMCFVILFHRSTQTPVSVISNTGPRLGPGLAIESKNAHDTAFGSWGHTDISQQVNFDFLYLVAFTRYWFCLITKYSLQIFVNVVEFMTCT